MAKKRGRKSVYDTKIKPHFDDILEMCKTMTDKQISEVLGVGYSTFMKFKSEKIEFQEILKKGRMNLVADLRGILINRAKGFHYEEVETIEEYGTITKKITKRKYAQPDVASINLLLKNYDKDNWANDPQALEIKKKELELKEKQVDNNLW